MEVTYLRMPGICPVRRISDRLIEGGTTMKLAHVLERLGAYQEAASYAEEVKSLIRSSFPEALFDPLRPAVGGDTWVLGVYTRDNDGWAVLGLVEDLLRDLLMQRRVAIAVVPLPFHHYLDEDIVY
jgi:hypothetical protein